MAMVLEGIRVLDFSRFVSGPYATMVLADMGAEVIRVEKPGGADDRELGPIAPGGESLPYGIIMARNKKGITLDIRSEEGGRLLARLVEKSDVVVHNFGPGSPESDLLGYDRLRRINPRVILAAVSGFGQTGPYTRRVCFDSVAQAMSGAMSYTGFPGNPPTRAAAPFVDVGTALYTALGVMFALYRRAQTGVGQLVDVAMFDMTLSCVNSVGVAAEYQLLNFVRQQHGNQSLYCFSDLFRTRDGWVMVNIMSNALWGRLCKVLGKNDWKTDARFKDNMSRYENRALIVEGIAPWMAERTTAVVIETLEAARVPCGKVNTISEMVADPQVRAREMLPAVDFPGVGAVPMPGIVPKLSETPGSIRHRAPLIGEHSDEVYCGLLNLDRTELATLREKGIV
jgi:crotonobetainyl-CoA:carnitine CoA-transferase CaiB-like acyl-CoA transferase